MNPLTDHANNPLQDFFFRTADRMRVEGCANAIANEGLSLVLYSPHEALLDHYLGLLLERLRRQSPQPRIEVYFPTSTESLLARFNDVLAKQSVKEATRLPEDSDSAQIWIVHDTQQLPDQEIQLMARLIQNFPGANIRAILLMTGNNPQKASLSAMGRKVLRWDIEAPTPEQVQIALDTAAQSGQLQAATQLLRRMGRLTEPDVGLDFAPSPAGKASEPEPLPSPKTKRFAAALARWRQRAGQWIGAVRQRLQLQAGAAAGNKLSSRLTLVLGLALLTSVAVMAWVQPQAFGLSRPAASPAPQPKPVEPSPVAQAAAASEPAPEVPDESQQSQAWVRDLSSNSFLIQHASVMTYEKALATLKTVPAQANAKIVAAYRPGESLAHFVIVSGPFDTLGKAYESIKRKEGTKNSWVRATKTLQDQITGPTRPQEVRP